MDKLTVEIIKEQIIGETNGHMGSMPNSPILYSIFESYRLVIESDGKHVLNSISRGTVFKRFISDLNKALQDA